MAAQPASNALYGGSVHISCTPGVHAGCSQPSSSGLQLQYKLSAGKPMSLPGRSQSPDLLPADQAKAVNGRATVHHPSPGTAMAPYGASMLRPATSVLDRYLATPSAAHSGHFAAGPAAMPDPLQPGPPDAAEEEAGEWTSSNTASRTPSVKSSAGELHAAMQPPEPSGRMSAGNMPNHANAWAATPQQYSGMPPASGMNIAPPPPSAAVAALKARRVQSATARISAGHVSGAQPAQLQGDMYYHGAVQYATTPVSATPSQSFEKYSLRKNRPATPTQQRPGMVQMVQQQAAHAMHHPDFQAPPVSAHWVPYQQAHRPVQVKPQLQAQHWQPNLQERAVRTIMRKVTPGANAVANKPAAAANLRTRQGPGPVQAHSAAAQRGSNRQAAPAANPAARTHMRPAAAGSGGATLASQSLGYEHLADADPMGPYGSSSGPPTLGMWGQAAQLGCSLESAGGLGMGSWDGLPEPEPRFDVAPQVQAWVQTPHAATATSSMRSASAPRMRPAAQPQHGMHSQAAPPGMGPAPSLRSHTPQPGMQPRQAWDGMMQHHTQQVWGDGHELMDADDDALAALLDETLGAAPRWEPAHHVSHTQQAAAAPSAGSAHFLQHAPGHHSRHATQQVQQGHRGAQQHLQQQPHQVYSQQQHMQMQQQGEEEQLHHEQLQGHQPMHRSARGPQLPQPAAAYQPQAQWQAQPLHGRQVLPAPAQHPQQQHASYREPHSAPQVSPGHFSLPVEGPRGPLSDMLDAWLEGEGAAAEASLRNRPDTSAKQRAQEEAAIIHHMRALLQRCLRGWKRVSDEHSAELFFAQAAAKPPTARLLRSVMCAWAQWVGDVRAWRAEGLALASARAAARCLRAWASVVQQGQHAEVAAVQHVRAVRLRRAILGLRQAVERRRVKAIADTIACTYDTFRCRRRAMRAWVVVWCRAGALRVFSAHRAGRIAYLVLQQLRANVMYQQDKRAAQGAAYAHYDRSLKGAALSALRMNAAHAAAARLHAEQDAAGHRAAVLLRAGLMGLEVAAARARQRMDGVVAWADHKLAYTCLTGWWEAAVGVPRAEELVATNLLRLLHRCMAGWRQAAAVSRYRRCRVLATCLHAWAWAVAEASLAQAGELSTHSHGSSRSSSVSGSEQPAVAHGEQAGVVGEVVGLGAGPRPTALATATAAITAALSTASCALVPVGPQPGAQQPQPQLTQQPLLPYSGGTSSSGSGTSMPAAVGVAPAAMHTGLVQLSREQPVVQRPGAAAGPYERASTSSGLGSTEGASTSERSSAGSSGFEGSTSTAPSLGLEPSRLSFSKDVETRLFAAQGQQSREEGEQAAEPQLQRWQGEGLRPLRIDNTGRAGGPVEASGEQLAGSAAQQLLQDAHSVAPDALAAAATRRVTDGQVVAASRAGAAAALRLLPHGMAAGAASAPATPRHSSPSRGSTPSPARLRAAATPLSPRAAHIPSLHALRALGAQLWDGLSPGPQRAAPDRTAAGEPIQHQSLLAGPQGAHSNNNGQGSSPAARAGAGAAAGPAAEGSNGGGNEGGNGDAAAQHTASRSLAALAPRALEQLLEADVAWFQDMLSEGGPLASPGGGLGSRTAPATPTAAHAAAVAVLRASGGLPPAAAATAATANRVAATAGGAVPGGGATGAVEVETDAFSATSSTDGNDKGSMGQREARRDWPRLDKNDSTHGTRASMPAPHTGDLWAPAGRALPQQLPNAPLSSLQQPPQQQHQHSLHAQGLRSSHPAGPVMTAQQAAQLAAAQLGQQQRARSVTPTRAGRSPMRGAATPTRATAASAAATAVGRVPPRGASPLRNATAEPEGYAAAFKRKQQATATAAGTVLLTAPYQAVHQAVQMVQAAQAGHMHQPQAVQRQEEEEEGGAVYLEDFLQGVDSPQASRVSDDAGYRSYEVRPVAGCGPSPAPVSRHHPHAGITRVKSGGGGGPVAQPGLGPTHGAGADAGAGMGMGGGVRENVRAVAAVGAARNNPVFRESWEDDKSGAGSGWEEEVEQAAVSVAQPRHLLQQQYQHNLQQQYQQQYEQQQLYQQYQQQQYDRDQAAWQAQGPRHAVQRPAVQQAVQCSSTSAAGVGSRTSSAEYYSASEGGMEPNEGWWGQQGGDVRSAAGSSGRPPHHQAHVHGMALPQGITGPQQLQRQYEAGFSAAQQYGSPTAGRHSRVSQARGGLSGHEVSRGQPVGSLGAWAASREVASGVAGDGVGDVGAGVSPIPAVSRAAAVRFNPVFERGMR